MEKTKIKMVKDVLIIGAGSVGGHVATNQDDYLEGFEIIGFLDDDKTKQGKKFVDFPVLGGITDLNNYDKNINIIIGIAFPKLKHEITERLLELGYNNIISIVSKRAWISNNVEIGKGVIVYPGTTINYNTKIEDFVVVNMNCAIGHDSIIQKYTSLSPGVSLGGNNNIGALSEMGIGSSTLQYVTIADSTIVGGQSMVTKSINKSCTVIGVPAKEL